MKSVIALIALSLGALSYALPLDPIGRSEVLNENLQLWKNELYVAGNQLRIGVNYNKDGTLSAGARYNIALDRSEVPLSASISTNVNNPKEFKYEVGTTILDKITGIIYGTADGALKYLVSATSPVVNGLSTTGVAVEGDQLIPKTVTVGVSQGSDIVQAVIGLGDDAVPESINVQLAADPRNV